MVCLNEKHSDHSPWDIALESTPLEQTHKVWIREQKQTRELPPSAFWSRFRDDPRENWDVLFARNIRITKHYNLTLPIWQNFLESFWGIFGPDLMGIEFQNSISFQENESEFLHAPFYQTTKFISYGDWSCLFPEPIELQFFNLKIE